MTSYIPALVSLFGPKVVLPGTQEYSERISTYQSAFESELTPTSIINPTSAHDAATIVHTLTSLPDFDDVKIAVRGGGQVPLPGAANIDTGLTVDLFQLTGVQISDDKTSVKIAAGESWGSVYEKLDKMHLSVAGGRSSKAGIGGLALDGGLSFFSFRKRFICDNVINYEIVLSSGKIVNANAVEHTDLFTALKGGSNNFGIVTSYDMRTFEQGEMWGGRVFYLESHFPTQLEALYNLTTDEESDRYIHLLISIGFAANYGGMMCQNTVYYTQSVQNPPVLQPFTTMQPQISELSSLRLGLPKNFTDEQAARTQTSQRMFWMTTTIKPNLALMQTIAQKMDFTLSPIKAVDGFVYALTFQPITKNMLVESAAAGPNSLGLDPADGPMMLILFLASWANKKDDEKVVQAQQKFVAEIDAIAEERCLGSKYKFMNHAFTGQNVIDGFGQQNKQKLQAVSKKYDPAGFFQKRVPGGFKLFV